MKKLLLIAFGLVSIGAFRPVLGQFYSGGTGYKYDPFLISNKADLKYLSENFSEWNKHFRQTADIVFTAADFQVGGDFFNSSQGFLPIGNTANKFTGSYRGSGHTISNLKVNKSSNFAGFFGWASGGAFIERLGLVNVTITGTDYAAALVGYTDDVKIYNCYSTGTVSGTQYVGGLVGFFSLNTMEKSYSTCSITATQYAGGITGENDGDIQNCYATGSVNAPTDYVGGLVGFNNKTITNSYSTGAITGTNNAGGLVGYNLMGTLTNCFWDTQTSGKATSSGAATGKTTTEMKTLGTFTNWNFTSTWQLSASNYPKLKWQVSTCAPSSKTITATAYEGYDLNEATYTASGTYVQVLTNSKDCDSTITLNLTIAPYPFSGGAGTVGNPYRIATKTDLDYLSEHSITWGFQYRQTADIVYSAADFQSGGDYYNFGFGFTPIGTLAARFTGSYNGNGFVIENLVINQPSLSEVGLFGVTHTTSTISNVELKNGNINGGNSVGSIVGINYGTVLNCNASGTINGASEVGGLVGKNIGVISRSYSTVDVTGYNYTGGLLGYNYYFSTTNGAVDNCYATGDVTGNSLVGGLIGDVYSGTVENCYSTGTITANGYLGGLIGYNDYGTITSCYWDTEASARATSGAGTGKTTAEMQTQSTFTNWDFTTIWEIQASSYPVLRAGIVAPTIPASGDSPAFTAFPSPTSDVLNFSATTPYEILNSFGVTLLKGNGDRADVSSLSTGVYSLSVNGKVVKFVKQ